MSRPVRLRGSPVRTLSKNFLHNHQLDVHLCTEFLCTWYQQDCLSRLVYR